MSDVQHQSRNLNEIGHLFLSSVRERQTNGAPLPRRKPPGMSIAAPPVMEIGLAVTPKETMPMDAISEANPPAADERELRFPPVTAILGAHLNDQHFDSARQYARHLAAAGQRIGLIEVDQNEFRLICFDQTPLAIEGDPTDDFNASDSGSEPFDPRAITDALDELSWDLDRWLIALPNPRTCEARCLLGDVGHWVLLSTCDHDGIVGCYRMLKGLGDTLRPRLSLALLDAADAGEADKTHRKLAGVCGQFLDWELQAESPVAPAPAVTEHRVMCVRPSTNAADSVIAPHWQVVADFLTRANAAAEPFSLSSGASGDCRVGSLELGSLKNRVTGGPPVSLESKNTGGPPVTRDIQGVRSQISNLKSPPSAPAIPETPIPDTRNPIPAPPTMRFAAQDAENTESISEVIDLPDAPSTTSAILSAILRAESTDLTECPVAPPKCPDAKLAVTTGRRVILLAVARQGLGDLRSIGLAYNWLIENHTLIAMAVPQLSIDLASAPQLRLLIDHADLTADILQPMLQSGTVTVQAYRRLRWGNKSGLLLDAA